MKVYSLPYLLKWSLPYLKSVCVWSPWRQPPCKENQDFIQSKKEKKKIYFGLFHFIKRVICTLEPLPRHRYNWPNSWMGHIVLHKNYCGPLNSCAANNLTNNTPKATNFLTCCLVFLLVLPVSVPFPFRLLFVTGGHFFCSKKIRTRHPRNVWASIWWYR